MSGGSNKKKSKSQNKKKKSSPKKGTPRTYVNPVSPSLGDPNAFNLLLEKHSTLLEVFSKMLLLRFIF